MMRNGINELRDKWGESISLDIVNRSLLVQVEHSGQLGDQRIHLPDGTWRAEE